MIEKTRGTSLILRRAVQDEPGKPAKRIGGGAEIPKVLNAGVNQLTRLYT
jgi:hypothetical protein